MPQVPLPRVGLTTNPTPAYGAPSITPRKDYSGEQTQKLGAAMQKAGQVAMQIVEMEQNEQDLASTKKYASQLQMKLSGLVDDDYLLKLGEAAVGGSDGKGVTEGAKLIKTIEQEIQKLQNELPTEVSRGMFREHANKLFTQQKMRINNHESRQRKAWLAQETATMINAETLGSIEAALVTTKSENPMGLDEILMGATPPPSDWRESFDDPGDEQTPLWEQRRNVALDQVRDLAELEGWGDETTAAAIEETRTKIYSGIVTGFLDNKETTKAKDFLEDHRKDMNTQVARKLRDSIKNIEEADRNAALGEKIWSDVKKAEEAEAKKAAKKAKEVEAQGKQRIDTPTTRSSDDLRRALIADAEGKSDKRIDTPTTRSFDEFRRASIADAEGPPEAPVETDPLRPGGPPVSKSNTMRSALTELRRRLNLPEGDPKKIKHEGFRAAWSHIRLLHSAEMEATATDITEYLLEVEQFQENHPGVSVDSRDFPRDLRDRGLALGRLDDARIMHSRIPATPEARREQAADFLRAMRDVDSGVFKDMTYTQFAARYYGKLRKDQWTWVKSLFEDSKSSDGGKPYGQSLPEIIMKWGVKGQIVSGHSPTTGKWMPEKDEVLEYDEYRRACLVALEKERQGKKRALTTDEENEIVRGVALEGALTTKPGWPWGGGDRTWFPKEDEDYDITLSDERVIDYKGTVGALGDTERNEIQDNIRARELAKSLGSNEEERAKIRAGIKRHIESIKEGSKNPTTVRSEIEKWWSAQGAIAPTQKEIADMMMEEREWRAVRSGKMPLTDEMKRQWIRSGGK